MTLEAAVVSRIVTAALAEDLGAEGDVTSRATIPEDRSGRARFVAREPLTLAGLPIVREVFRQLDPALVFRSERSDGDTLAAGATVAIVEGSARRLLEGERTALNFLQRLSGIATATRAAVDEVSGTGVAILDTRKTAPGLRPLDKYAVATGGGTNHRMGLFDAAMVKDTHLGAGGSISEAVRACLTAGVPRSRVTAEVRTIDELREAIAAGAGRALLDNMSPDTLVACVREGKGKLVLEASGGLKPGALRAVAATGVDCLSLGYLTHSVRAADLAMDLEPLLNAPAVIDRERLARELSGVPWVKRLVVHEQTASTNDDARELAADGAPDGTVVVAASQTAGRGRLGRAWHSPPGTGLYLSGLFRPDDSLEQCGRYALAAAVAACSACREFAGPAPLIKWPNDVLAGGRKLGGILAEIRTGRKGLELTVGIGVNLNHADGDLPAELRATGTSLRILRGGEPVVLESFAARLLTHLGVEFTDLRTDGWERVANRFLGYAPQTQGARVRLAAGGTGVTQGLDTTGALRVATEGGVVLVHAGESIAVLEG